jgi:hypothetical protein
MPHRVQLSRTKGWRMPPNTIKVDRSTAWGNPFVIGKDGDREACVVRYRELLRGRVAGAPDAIATLQARREYTIAHIDELRGKNLACWCRTGQPCHADVLLEMANRD